MTLDAPPPFDAEKLRADLDLCTLGERFYLKTLDQISPAGMAQPSILPGWSRVHVAMHIVHNAEGFMRLLEWARTGTENPMYPSRAERDAQIEESAAHTSGEAAIAIAHEVVAELEGDFARMDDAAWSATVVSGRGDDIRAAEIPWLRAREVFVHALDLGIGATTLDFPAAVVDRLLGDIAPIWEKKGLRTHYVLTLTDRDGDLVIRTGEENPAGASGAGSPAASSSDGGSPADAASPEASEAPVEVSGEAAEVLSYLMGRGWPRSTAERTDKGVDGAGTPRDLPTPPAWL
ncbi:maleylpyruvate isomerase N-terminal domain-containing protein [Brevibacterium sp.]|uniref:maleylpyruvate isomerase N-terminal domain-containing protein n=1 Tax=Brevibacterium sp. TaxID=1701 RepID=UPI0025B93B18|nr:maleylpyruvate isomerase N-terminal domain-containing protein [Brevibacterium sp.]